MNPDQLSALFTQHRGAVLGGAAVVVVGLGLYSRKVKQPAAAAGPVGAAVPGTIPAAAVAPTAGYDSTATDVYQALSDQIAAAEQRQQTTGTPAAAPHQSIASTLFAPTGTGNYVRYGSGTIAEVESDGSVYGIAPGENWNYDGNRTPVQLPWYSAADGGPAYGDKVTNLTAAGKTK